SFDSPTLRLCFLLGACGWWVIAAVLVIAAEAGRDVLPTRKLPLVGLGWVVLIPSYLALVWLHAMDLAALLFLFALVWAIDSAAYFAGRRWGQRRLAPNVSPGKTWLGALVGIGAAIAVALGAVTVWSHDLVRSAPLAVLLACLTAVSAISGDLFESLMKRRHGLKDSGSLLPGHGGALDRIDSVLAAAPVYATFVFFQARVP
ncbi:MAG: phosphatidate cytidylyltransferase, partial [Gammaproteobacteria bacterium]